MTGDWVFLLGSEVPGWWEETRNLEKHRASFLVILRLIGKGGIEFEGGENRIRGGRREEEDGLMKPEKIYELELTPEKYGGGGERLKKVFKNWNHGKPNQHLQ